MRRLTVRDCYGQPWLTERGQRLALLAMVALLLLAAAIDGMEV